MGYRHYKEKEDWLMMDIGKIIINWVKNIFGGTVSLREEDIKAKPVVKQHDYYGNRDGFKIENHGKSIDNPIIDKDGFYQLQEMKTAKDNIAKHMVNRDFDKAQKELDNLEKLRERMQMKSKPPFPGNVNQFGRPGYGVSGVSGFSGVSGAS